MHERKKLFKNFVRKRKKEYWYTAFSPFPTMFFYNVFKLSSANALNLDKTSVLSSDNGLSYEESANASNLDNPCSVLVKH